MRFAMADSPSQATFLSPVERTWLQQRNADLKASLQLPGCTLSRSDAQLQLPQVSPGLFLQGTKRPQTPVLSCTALTLAADGQQSGGHAALSHHCKALLQRGPQ